VKDPYIAFLLDQIRPAREAAGLSKTDLARRLHISRQQWTAIENGRSTINFVHLYNLSVVLGVRFVIGASGLPLARGAVRR